MFLFVYLSIKIVVLLIGKPTPAQQPEATANPTASLTSHPTHTNHRNKATIREFYIDSLDNIQEEPTSHDIIRISLPFNTSNRTHGARVFTENCTTEFDTNHIYFKADTSNPISSHLKAKIIHIDIFISYFHPIGH